MSTNNPVRISVIDSAGIRHNLDLSGGDAASVVAQLVSQGVVAPGVVVRRVVDRDGGRWVIVGPCPFCGRDHRHVWPRGQSQPGERQAPCGRDRWYLLLASLGQLAGMETRQ